MLHRFVVILTALLSLQPLYLDLQPGVFPDSAFSQLLAFQYKSEAMGAGEEVDVVHLGPCTVPGHAAGSAV